MGYTVIRPWGHLESQGRRRRCLPAARDQRNAFYVWKKRYGHLGVHEARRVRQLEDENARLKRLVADLTLDKHMLARRSGARVDASERMVSGECAGLVRD